MFDPDEFRRSLHSKSDSDVERLLREMVEKAISGEERARLGVLQQELADRVMAA